MFAQSITVQKDSPITLFPVVKKKKLYSSSQDLKILNLTSYFYI